MRDIVIITKQAKLSLNGKIIVGTRRYPLQPGLTKSSDLFGLSCTIVELVDHSAKNYRRLQVSQVGSILEFYYGQFIESVEFPFILVYFMLAIIPNPFRVEYLMHASIYLCCRLSIVMLSNVSCEFLSANYVAAAVATAGVLGGTYYAYQAYKTYQKHKIPTEWRQIGTLQQLYAYPIKSCGPVTLDKAECSILGLRDGWLQDRQVPTYSMEMSKCAKKKLFRT